jgi:hypothetical protein
VERKFFWTWEAKMPRRLSKTLDIVTKHEKFSRDYLLAT